MHAEPDAIQAPPASPLIIHFNRPRMLALALLGPAIVLVALSAALLELVFLFVLGIALSGIARPATDFWIRLAASGLLFLSYWPKLFDRRPALILTDEYLEDNSSLASYGRIPWANIYDIQSATFGCSQCISVFATTLPDNTQGEDGIARALRGQFEAHVGSPVQLCTECLTISRADLMSALYNRFERYLNHTDPSGDKRGIFVKGAAYAPRQEYLVPYEENSAVTRHDP